MARSAKAARRVCAWSIPKEPRFGSCCRAIRCTMKFGTRTTNHQSAFTLAEVLAALLFMAMVITVALEGRHVASRAGSVAVRKREATRVAERILNESIITTNWNNGGSQVGAVVEGIRQFQWTLRNEPWNVDQNASTMRLL